MAGVAEIVETYLPRRDVFDTKAEVMQGLADVETTWVSRALNEGRQEGMHTSLLLMFSTKFGELPKSFVSRLNAIIDPATLAEISRQLLTAQTLDEITLLNPRNN